MKRWTTEEIGYVEAHAHDGAASVAEVLGRTPHAVEVQASKWGISLVTAPICPRCGLRTFAPLSPKTGWCRTCTVGYSRDNAVLRDRELRLEMAAEKRRVEAAERERQAIYNASYKVRRSRTTEKKTRNRRQEQ